MIDVLRIALGVPALLLLPGFALVAALYGSAMPERALTVALSIALSMAAAILTGLALHALDVRIDAASLLVAEAGVTGIAGVVALVRRRGAMPPLRAPSGPVRAWAASLLACAAVFAGLLAFSREPLGNASVAGYTSLSARLLPGDRVTLAVQSSELRPARFELVASAGGKAVVTERITLRPGQEWRATRALGRPLPQVLEVRLYRLPDRESVYRDVTLRA